MEVARLVKQGQCENCRTRWGAVLKTSIKGMGLFENDKIPEQAAAESATPESEVKMQYIYREGVRLGVESEEVDWKVNVQFSL